MQKKLTGSLLAASCLMLSSLTFAAGPVQLSAAEMDGVTAGLLTPHIICHAVDLVEDIVNLPRSSAHITADALHLSAAVRTTLGL